MSRSHVRVSEPSPHRRRWLEVTSIATVAIVIAALMIARLPRESFDRDHVTAVGSILETRIVKVGSGQGMYGGYVLYRIEVRVLYTQLGQPQDRWLVASDITSSREWLQMQISSRPKTCEVYWLPNHPENAKCRL